MSGCVRKQKLVFWELRPLGTTRRAAIGLLHFASRDMRRPRWSWNTCSTALMRGKPWRPSRHATARTSTACATTTPTPECLLDLLHQLLVLSPSCIFPLLSLGNIVLGLANALPRWREDEAAQGQHILKGATQQREHLVWKCLGKRHVWPLGCRNNAFERRMEVGGRHIDLWDVNDQLVGWCVDLGELSAERNESRLSAQCLEICSTVPNSLFWQLEEKWWFEWRFPRTSVNGENTQTILKQW